mmetsp:Transcript_40762/g.161538  ORF Transcript_40762/g.161538 Transcript_40762/m.161538 type:complete len:91 (-) Transcript_40762:2693-2965(-)
MKLSQACLMLSYLSFSFRCFISTAYKIDAQDLRSEFRTVPVHVQTTKADKTGLEALYRRTVEPLSDSERVEKEVSREENEVRTPWLSGFH